MSCVPDKNNVLTIVLFICMHTGDIELAAQKALAGFPIDPLGRYLIATPVESLHPPDLVTGHRFV